MAAGGVVHIVWYATGFRAEADYALRVSLLGVATASTRKQLLAELRACERALVRPGNRAA